MKKKFIIILLSAVMAASAAACGDGAKEENKAGNTKTDDSASGGGEGAASSVQVEYDVKECVKLGDYSKLHLSLPKTYEVTEKEIEDYAQNMAKYYAQPVYKDTDKKTVEDGDTVNIDYEGKKDGTAFDGGTAQGQYLTIGSGQFIDGFEDGLIGKKVGETVDLDLTFPEGYQNEELSGQAVVFTVKINKIVKEDKSAKFELNDEFVQQNFNYKNVEEYNDKIKEFLEKSNETSKNSDTRQAAVEELLKICEVDIPDGMLDMRTAEYIELFTKQNGIQSSGSEEDGDENTVTMEVYLKENLNGISEEEFYAKITEEMETNLKTELILEAAAQKEGIQLDEDEFQEYVQQQMSSGGYESEKDLYEANGRDEQSGEQYMKKIFLGNKALDKILEKAEIEYGVETDTDSGQAENDDQDADES